MPNLATAVFEALLADNGTAKQLVADLTIATAVDLNNPDRKQLSAYNPQLCLMAIVRLLNNATKFFGNTAFEIEVALELADLVRTEYWFMTIGDIALCFRQAKTGKYRIEGQFQEQANTSTIFRWLDAYNAERMRHIEAQRIKERAAHENEKPANNDLSAMYAKAKYKPEANSRERAKAQYHTNQEHPENTASFEAERARQLRDMEMYMQTENV